MFLAARRLCSAGVPQPYGVAVVTEPGVANGYGSGLALTKW